MLNPYFSQPLYYFSEFLLSSKMLFSMMSTFTLIPSTRVRFVSSNSLFAIINNLFDSCASRIVLSLDSICFICMSVVSLCILLTYQANPKTQAIGNPKDSIMLDNSAIYKSSPLNVKRTTQIE